ncbi:nuclear receptor subfamily 2 group E member 1 isoform X2 [Anthonomus grandis grandis]|nr:nuclear receptor subfamily 2 group E member 1 isoform X2 [Anthonomus grandis grandis]
MLRLEQHQAQQMQLKVQCQSSSGSSSRILDIPCKVCGDYSSGKHYNIFACDGCAGFFKRSIRRNRKYICKGKEEGSCIIDKTHRNQCRACRLEKCQEAGMNKDAVQHERGPRNSTIRRAMSTFFEHHQRANIVYGSPSEMPQMTSSGGSAGLDLVLPKSALSPPSHLDTPIIGSISVMPSSSFGFVHGIPAVPFQPPSLISPPITPPPAVMTPEDICESAARLLFLNVQWTKSLPYFLNLPMSDQLLLLEESWKDLFILGAAQFLPIIDLSSLMETNEAIKKEGSALFIQRVHEFQDTLVQMKHFHLDSHEYSFLRVISLFRPVGLAGNDESKALLEERSVQMISNDAQMSLNKYLTTTRLHDPLRFSKEFLLLSRIRSLSAEAIEELFFKKAVGSIPIVKIIADMYRSQQR